MTNPPTLDLTDWEVQILREVAGELPASPWGAAVGRALEHLYESGYLTSTFGTITEKGREALAALSPSKPQEHPHD